MSANKPTFLPISPYVESPANLQAKLTADIRADVAIIGGGFTGLSTALALKAKGIDAVIIEKNFCGYGSSGRNAGHLTPTICKDLPTAVMMFGKKRTGELARFADYCVESAEDLIQRYNIDCDYNPSGNIMAVMHPAQEKRLRKAAAVAQSVGAKMHFCEADEMQERGLPKAFFCGAMEEVGGTLHPGKFVQGLRSEALRQGITIYEQTEVTGIIPGTPVKVVTDNGSVAADKLVMGTNAYTPDVSPKGNRVFPLLITLFESAPLSDEQLDALGGWTGREGIYTAHESMESYRLTAQRTIIGGSKGVQYFYGGKTANHATAETTAIDVVAKAFAERFPELGQTPIQHTWTGWIGMTNNFLPVVGQFGGHKNIYQATGYNGHGAAQASSMGMLLADAIAGEQNEWLDIISRRPIYLLPEPIRWLFVKSLMALVNSIDRRRDKQMLAKRLAENNHTA